MYSRFVYRAAAAVAAVDADEFYENVGASNQMTSLISATAKFWVEKYSFCLVRRRRSTECQKVVWDINANEVKKRAIIDTKARGKQYFFCLGKLTEKKIRLKEPFLVGDMKQNN